MRTCIRYVWSPGGAGAATGGTGLASTGCPGSADVEVGLFVGSMLPLLFRALLTFRFSGVGRIILGHESELTVLANDVGKIGCNAHRVRDALICRRASRDLHESKSRGKTLVPMPSQRGRNDTFLRALP